jgi:cell division septation protein DedD
MPGGDITVEVTVSSSTEIVVSVGINIIYDSDLLEATGCTVTQGVALCNLKHNENALRLVMADAFDGLSGVVGSVTFHAVGAAGTTTNLHLVVTTCGDPEGSPLNCAAQDGTIVIANQTPSPSPTPTPFPTPTQVPEHTSTPSPSVSPKPTLSPTPTHTPEPTSTPFSSLPPTPTQAPRLWGDVNCDGSVNSVDALTLMRWTAGLPVLQVEPCPEIGAPYP